MNASPPRLALLLVSLVVCFATVAPVDGGEPSADTGAALAENDTRSAPEQEEQKERADDYEIFEELLVVGSLDTLQEVAGSAHVITKEALERQAFQDVHRVLRQVPGLNVQEEDGFGLRPNIGIRGTGVERSSKITMLEDGILIAPAPYAAPSAYYAPTAGRMEGFEVRKGSGAIRQGPYTNGGSINYLSTSIPGRFAGALEAAAGSDGLRRARAHAGASNARAGWLVEAYDMSHDGFKELDGGSTGFSLNDYLGKLRLTSEPSARIRQTLELKLGRTEQDGDETYLGLTAADFSRTPFRRYAASAGDRLRTTHDQIQLSYEVRPSDRFKFTVTAYRNDFFRNWAKLEKVDGIGVATVLEAPEEHPDQLAVLRGETDSSPGALAVRNNRRDYYSTGLQAVFGFTFESPSTSHDLDLGLRLHEDAEDRFQEEDAFRMLDGRRVLDQLGAAGSHANRIASAEAVAFFAQDTIRRGRWTLSPGLRIEAIDLMRRDFGTADPDRAGHELVTRANSLTEVIPGVGLSYALDDARQLFFGVHRGFAPPSPSSTENVQAEESLNFELGYRLDRGATRAELVAFFNDYENLLGTDTTSGGGSGSGDQFNGGAATVAGLEAGLAGRWMERPGLAVPVSVTYTHTVGEFDTGFQSSFADWAPQVDAGDELPYIPEHQLNATLSLQAPRWALHLDGNYTTEMRTRSGRGPILAEERIGDRLLFDLRAELSLFERYQIFAQLLNATDELYVAARRPAGLRPGLPRSLIVGLRASLGGTP